MLPPNALDFCQNSTCYMDYYDEYNSKKIGCSKRCEEKLRCSEVSYQYTVSQSKMIRSDHCFGQHCVTKNSTMLTAYFDTPYVMRITEKWPMSSSSLISNIGLYWHKNTTNLSFTFHYIVTWSLCMFYLLVQAVNSDYGLACQFYLWFSYLYTPVNTYCKWDKIWAKIKMHQKRTCNWVYKMWFQEQANY